MASKITIPDLKKIRVTDPLFSHYAGMVAKKMIPVQWEILNGKQGQSRCFCIDNFRIAGGTLQGEHRGVVFGDTDAYKWLEAVAYCANNGETEYISQADELIEIIGQAQQPDGYLNTYFTVCHPELRWKNHTECHEARKDREDEDRLLALLHRPGRALPGEHPGYFVFRSAEKLRRGH